MSNYRKLYFALLAGTILSTPATAAEEKEITVDYLNSLTGPKVTWSESEGTYQINLLPAKPGIMITINRKAIPMPPTVLTIPLTRPM